MRSTRMLQHRFQLQRRTLALLVLASAMLTASGSRLVRAQPSIQSQADRDKLYEQLAREADAVATYFGHLKRVVQLTRPTVVHIEANHEESDRFGRSRSVEEAGSGVIFESAGKFYVITNRHVIHGAPLSDIDIRLTNGRLVHPTNVWSDSETDIAVMRLSQTNLTPARLGDSGRVEIGDFVLAVGSPFGLSHSVTYGIVSAKGRRDLELGGGGVKYQNFIQTDAAINPGNSGGPLLNLKGEVIGINTAIASSSGGNEGIGFSIPINMVMIIANQLVATGQVRRAFLGVSLDSKFGADSAVQLGLPRLMGAKVSGITPDSPAANAQLQVGDIILRFDEFAVGR